MPRKSDFQKNVQQVMKKEATSRRIIPTTSSDPVPMHLKPMTEEMYSRKVFVGGLPIDIKESTVYNIFSQFGKVMIDWPRRLDAKPDQARPMAGYVFLVFEEEASVQSLIANCFYAYRRLV